MTKENPDIPQQLGKYEIRSVLGHGAMGIVYKAYDPKIARDVALKTVLKSQLNPDDIDGALARFRQEAQAAGRLLHPNIISVFDYDEQGDNAFIAMEYVEGVDLQSFMQKRKRLRLKDTLRIMKQLLDALQFSHERGVVHRDIKPANVFVLRNGVVKIGDFGIAKISNEASSLTRTGTILGTPYYMSPEHFSGTDVDGRSDLFSMGVMFYEMLTGTKPFTGDLPSIMRQVLTVDPAAPSAINPELPRELDEVVLKALAKSPQRRFQNAEAFSKALLVVVERLKNGTKGVELDTTDPAIKTGEGRELYGETNPKVKRPETEARDKDFIKVSRWSKGDYRTISEAIRNARPHARIMVEPATYVEELIVDKPLEIIGDGPTENIIVQSRGSNCLKFTTDLCRIQNISFQGRSNTNAAVEIKQGAIAFFTCNFSSESKLCISVSGKSARPYFKNCRIHHSKGTGIRFIEQSAGKVENCSMKGNPVAGIFVAKGCNPTIVGGEIQDKVVREGEQAKRPSMMGQLGTLRRKDSDGGDSLKGTLIGGALAGTVYLIIKQMGLDVSLTPLLIALGAGLGWYGARGVGVLLGIIAAFIALLPVEMPMAVKTGFLEILGLSGAGGDVVLSSLNAAIRGALMGFLAFLGIGLLSRSKQRD